MHHVERNTYSEGQGQLQVKAFVPNLRVRWLVRLLLRSHSICWSVCLSKAMCDWPSRNLTHMALIKSPFAGLFSLCLILWCYFSPMMSLNQSWRQTDARTLSGSVPFWFHLPTVVDKSVLKDFRVQRWSIFTLPQHVQNPLRRIPKYLAFAKPEIKLMTL